jgi:pyruvate/2-oxoglutarate dehydrogenase complex dihydrolipoamide acyltransferase (E2) component
MSTIRHTISCRMMDSLECSAQMTAFGEWDVTELMKLRQVMNGQMAESGLKVTFPGLMVFLLARVLKEMPVFNASVEDRKILYWKDVNIGVAVSVGENLVVPVIRGADRKTISGIQETMNDLIERARSRKLMPDDMEGGTFTLSNVGSYGSKWETVILNPPEVALLGIGAVEKKPVVIGDSIEIRQIMPISFTFDHRIIDGATAGRFRQRMKSLVENPGMLITCFPEDEEA